MTKTNKVLKLFILILNTPNKDGIKVPLIPLPCIYVKYLSNNWYKGFEKFN